MKKQSDFVILVRNGVEINAMVVESHIVKGEEQLRLTYFDPESGFMQFRNHGTLAQAFSVLRMKEGATNGWKEYGLQNYQQEPSIPIPGRDSWLDLIGAFITPSVLDMAQKIADEHPIPGSDSWLDLNGAFITPSVLDMAQDIADEHDGEVTLRNVAKRPAVHDMGGFPGAGIPDGATYPVGTSFVGDLKYDGGDSDPASAAMAAAHAPSTTEAAPADAATAQATADTARTEADAAQDAADAATSDKVGLQDDADEADDKADDLQEAADAAKDASTASGEPTT